MALEPFRTRHGPASGVVGPPQNHIIPYEASRRIRPTVGPYDLPRTSWGSHLTPWLLRGYWLSVGAISYAGPPQALRFLWLLGASTALNRICQPDKQRMFQCFSVQEYLVRQKAPPFKTLLRPFSRPMPRVLWWSYGEVLLLMSEVPLCGMDGRPTKGHP